MITLGINAAFHDSAAALVIDGQVVAAAEEERFSGIRHAKRPVPFSAWELPFHAIDFCLARAGLVLGDCDHIAYSFDPVRFVADPRLLDRDTLELPLLPPDPEAQGPWEDPWDPLFVAEIVGAPDQLEGGAPHHLRPRFDRGRTRQRPRWHFVDHLTCHQASAFLAAPYPRCAVLTLDGRGERASTAYGRHRDSRYEAFGQVDMPHSLGLLWQRVAVHLGFAPSGDEERLTALAALGDARRAGSLRGLVQVGQDGRFEVAAFDPQEVLGPPRRPDMPLAAQHFDIAAALQDELERSVLALAGWLRRATGERLLAMAGGVAANCRMNARLRDSGLYEGVWVQPAAGDAGTALGAALWTDARERRGLASGVPVGPNISTADGGPICTLAPRGWQMRDAFLGPEFGDAGIESLLVGAGLDHRRLDDIAGSTADLLARQWIVGWFQGRMAFGPRALGARSILAAPTDPAMTARLNRLKERDAVLPLSTVLPVEDLGRWFAPASANDGCSPFKQFVYQALHEQAARIPAACHVDGSARVQTVDATSQPRLHALLRAFGERTGVPVLVDTSFRARRGPIVCTPRDAIESFFGSPLDALVIGAFLVTKNGAPDARR